MTPLILNDGETRPAFYEWVKGYYRYSWLSESESEWIVLKPHRFVYSNNENWMYLCQILTRSYTMIYYFFFHV